MSKENLIDVFVDGLDFDPLVTLADILDVTVDPPPLDDMWPDWQNDHVVGWTLKRLAGICEQCKQYEVHPW